jgi:hypothetical protein
VEVGGIGVGEEVRVALGLCVTVGVRATRGVAELVELGLGESLQVGLTEKVQVTVPDGVAVRVPVKLKVSVWVSVAAKPGRTGTKAKRRQKHPILSFVFIPSSKLDLGDVRRPCRQNQDS